MQNLDWLRLNGHPKWDSVDLNEPVNESEQYPCVKNYIPTAIEATAEASLDQEPNPVADAIQAVFRP